MGRRCGLVTVADCAACGRPGLAEARYCPYCGEPVAEDDPYETRRVVSVVFCDLVGSTALSERMDPEPLRALVGRYYERMRRALEQHGGTVEKFIGDAVVGVFGVPELHEDDALQAVRAAVAMRREAEQLDRELSGRLGERLAVRLGVNTGEVMASGYGSNVRVTGEMVNVAARFQQAAGPGQIVVGAATRALVSGAVRLESLAQLRLKGKSAPVPAWLVRDVDPEAGGIERRMTAPLVAREPDLRFLRNSFAHVRDSGMTAIVTVYGVPGIGKSRLAQEFLGWAGSRAQVCSGRCPPFGRGASLGPLFGVLAELARFDQVDEELRAAAEALWAGAVEHTPDDVLWVARRLLAAVAVQGPLVVVLDDVQWAQPLLLDVLGRLADSGRDIPVLLLCLARLDLLDSRPDWSGGKLSAASTVLAPLHLEAARQLARDQFEVTLHDQDAEETVRGIAARSGGNPLYIEQLVSAVRDGSGIDALPLTIRALIDARLQRLDAVDGAILQWAAVHGMECSTGLLEGLLEGLLDATALQPELDRLAHRQLLDAVGLHTYRFRNLQIREVAYESIPKRIRAQMHERVAELLTEFDGDAAYESGDHLERALAYYRELGRTEDAEGLRSRTAAALRTAASRQLSHGDLHTAADLLGRALDAAPEDDPARSAMLTQLGTVLVATTRLGEARTALQQAAALAEERGDRAALAHARLGLVQLPAAQATPEDLLRAASEAVTVFTQAADARGLGKASSLIGQVHLADGRYRQAVEAFERGRPDGAAVADELHDAQSIGGLAFSLWRGPTPATQAVEECEKLLSGVPASCRLVRVAAMCPLAVLLAGRSQSARASELLAEAEHMVGEFSHEFARISISVFMAMVHSFAGELPAAEQRLREVCEALSPFGGAQHAAAAGDLIRVLLRLGRPDEAVDVLRSRPEWRDDEGDFPAGFFGARARAELAAGRTKEAEDCVRTALQLAAATDSPEIQAVALLDQAHVLHALGRQEEAYRAAERAHARYRAKEHLAGMAEAEQMLRQTSGSRTGSPIIREDGR
ncbi:AAA family ATPase [Streptomyces sp. NBC_00287]|uniref:adenylate/guanylate cyclase domain-containing protein n=1 Tax=Streptomyces sp. NBC_00287 TaxID=2975702 RepID=UPI002E2E07CC|nr:adenylate/guanylate cyclase domain-containing protein [Streptomyces sp. NBC_00287]